MKYEIERTSDYFRENSPRTDAYQEGVDRNGRPIWRIDIETLKELHKLIDEVDAPVIVYDDKLEIYDDFRE